MPWFDDYALHVQAYSLAHVIKTVLRKSGLTVSYCFSRQLNNDAILLLGFGRLPNQIRFVYRVILMASAPGNQ